MTNTDQHLLEQAQPPFGPRIADNPSDTSNACPLSSAGQNNLSPEKEKRQKKKKKE